MSMMITIVIAVCVAMWIHDSLFANNNDNNKKD